MSANLLFLWMMMEEEEEEERRRQEEEEERQREEEEANRRKIKHRKESPVVYNNEDWQRNRCVKAFSLQPCVSNFVSAIESVRPEVIKNEQKKFDGKILDVGYQYETVRRELDEDIEYLKENGINVFGDQYSLTRLSSMDSNSAKIEKTTDLIGNSFKVDDGVTFELNARILSDKKYFHKKYLDSYPEDVKKAYDKLIARIKRYQNVGKYLRFILRSRKYSNLMSRFDKVSDDLEECELKKRIMETYESLTIEQLTIIKSYFNHLAKLSSLSDKIVELFKSKANLENKNNQQVYDLTIKEIISRDEYRSLVEEVYDYISKITSNDSETMKEAYNLVKGEYPINIDRRFVYDLIIGNMSGYQKGYQKTLK